MTYSKTTTSERTFGKGSSLKVTPKGVATKLSVRRKPSQERSKERIANILKAAQACVLASGVANLKISDIARASSMPHGSIYQYFNNREEIIAALLKEHVQGFYEQSMGLFDSVSDEDGFIKYFETLVYSFHDFVKSDVTYREIWWGSQGWESLRLMDLQDNVRYAQAFTKRIEAFRPDMDPERTSCLCLMLVESAANVTRNAIKIGGKTERVMIDEMIRMASGYLRDVFATK